MAWPPRASTTRIAATAGTHGLNRIVNPWAEGANVKLVQKLLGHKSAVLTLRTVGVFKPVAVGPKSL